MPVEINKDIRLQIEHFKNIAADKIDTANLYFLRKQFSELCGEVPHLQTDQSKLTSTAKGMEILGYDIISRYYKDSELQEKAWKELLWPAYRIQRSIFLENPNNYQALISKVFDGLQANRQPEIRLQLEKIDLYKPLNNLEDIAWDEIVYIELIRAFLLIVRKKDGYEDLHRALKIIDKLKEMQENNEKKYLERDTGQNEYALHRKLSTIVALYNLVKLVQLTTEFLSGLCETRNISPKGLKGEIDRHVLNAREILHGGIDPRLRIFSNKLGEACKQLIDSSIYSVVMPPRTRKFLLGLSRTKSKPVLELLFSQREALKKSLLDPTKSAIVISMPTSSGKTLLAELAIIQTFHDDPDSKIIYLAPTRALVTQVALTLKGHLGKQLTIKIATPSFELNPIENEFLHKDFNILVTTPEKFDLLIRLNHESVKDISLVVVDEAHNINEKERGARLELLLATVKRERSKTRFILLTPFASNAGDIAYWLGDSQGVPIIIDWKPNDRVVGAIKPGKKVRNQDKREIIFETLGTIHSDYPEGEQLPIGCYDFVGNNDIDSKEMLCLNAALGWSDKKGGVLLLASGRQKAQERAKWIADQLPERKCSTVVDLVCRYLETEVGAEHDIIKMLKKGVAFHHSGLSNEARYLIERLMEIGEIKIICATTTLAQGVNFPLSAAIIEDHTRAIYNRGFFVRREDIKPWEFWNIAGRVGRTFEDELGIVAFAYTKKIQKEKIKQYLTKDASLVTSALLDLIKRLNGKENICFNRNLVENIKPASAFLQYIVHSLTISGIANVKDDIEGILRSSFVFEQARSENPEFAEELIRITRMYIDDLEKSKGKALSAYVKLADGTGFSSPSVDLLWDEWKKNRVIKIEDWTPEMLFPADNTESGTLVNAIDTLSKMPEIHLGSEEDGQFSVERIARITSSWVNGKSIIDIANEEYKGDVYKCISHINSSVTNLIPWGIRGIQHVSFAGLDDSTRKELDLIPSMIYHGVKTREAIALRMLNIPRFIAEGLVLRWKAQKESNNDIYDWIEHSTNNDWDNALPKYSKISGAECRIIWQLLDGKKSIRDIE